MPVRHHAREQVRRGQPRVHVAGRLLPAVGRHGRPDKGRILLREVRAHHRYGHWLPRGDADVRRLIVPRIGPMLLEMEHPHPPRTALERLTLRMTGSLDRATVLRDVSRPGPHPRIPPGLREEP